MALRWYYHQPCTGKQAAQQTDAAIVQVEQSIKSQDAAVEKIVTDAHKEVTVGNETIREVVKNLDADGVAGGLMALLGEYRSERGD